MSKDLLSNIINETESVKILPLKWKGITIPGYEISNQGELYKYGNKQSTWKVNGRNYASVIINGQRWQYRIDYMVAYTFIGYPDDAIRLIHIDDNIANDNRMNLMWYRKSDVMKEYINLSIIEEDGSIKEEWRPCYLEYNSSIKYEVSNLGMVRNANTHELIPIKENHDYRVFYYLDEKFAKQTRVKAVHRAVAEAFIPNPNKYSIVNHLDGNKFHDAVYNLEWTSPGMNTEHAYITKLNKNQKYSDNQIHMVCDLLSRRKVPQIHISYMTGVDRKTVSDIYRGRRWKDISSKYEFQVKKWNQSIKEEVCNMIINGMKGKEIFVKLNMPYDQSSISFYERMRRELKSTGKIS